MSKLGDIKAKGVKLIPFRSKTTAQYALFKLIRTRLREETHYPDLDPNFWETVRKFFLNWQENIYKGENMPINLPSTTTVYIMLAVAVLGIILEIFKKR